MKTKLAAALAGLCLAATALAQDFPSRPLRIVVPWPPSGNVDITARTVSPARKPAACAKVPAAGSARIGRGSGNPYRNSPA